MLIYFIDKVLENLVPYIPLMQSLIWPIAVLAFLLLFRDKFKRILAIIVERLESGSSVEAGPFKLGEKLASPSPEERDKKRALDLADAVTESPAEPEPDSITGRSKPTVVSPDSFLKKRELTRFSQIENAALSKVSDTIGIPITREVKPTSRSTMLFDGVALDSNGFRIVEVKIFRDAKQVKTTVRRFLDSVSSFCLTLEEKNRSFVSVILVVVIANDFQGDPSSVSRALASSIEGYTFPIRVEQFKEGDLIGHEEGSDAKGGQQIGQ